MWGRGGSGDPGRGDPGRGDLRQEIPDTLALSGPDIVEAFSGLINVNCPNHCLIRVHAGGGSLITITSSLPGY